MKYAKLGTIGGIVVLLTVLWFSGKFAVRGQISTDVLLGDRLLSIGAGFNCQPLVRDEGLNVKGSENKL